MTSHGTDATLCPVCGSAHAPAQESCQVRLASEPDRTRLDSGPFRDWTAPPGESGDTPPRQRRPSQTTAAGDHTSPISVENVPFSDLQSGTQIGEFVVDKKIGAGGMGVVYRATHPLIGKKAVIKVIKASLGGDAEHVQRFIREARAVNQINHPNIVDVFSFGTLPDRRPYLVMEWLRGESLGARLLRGKIEVREAVEILVQMVSALDAAHTYGVVHRDLKPDNVYLVALPNDDKPLVKLLDFGLAMITEATKDLFLRDSEVGVILGTPSYLSPEVARGTEVDHRSDIYTLGVLAFEMLSGRRPFVGNSPRDTILMHMTAPPPSVRAYVQDIPESIEALLLEMMAKNPAQRPTLPRVRAVLGGLLDGSQPAPFTTQAAPEEERTGASTAHFKPALRELAMKRPADWTGDVDRVALADLEERPEPPKEDPTRTDTDLFNKLVSGSSQDSAATPRAMPPVAVPDTKAPTPILFVDDLDELPESEASRQKRSDALGPRLRIPLQRRIGPMHSVSDEQAAPSPLPTPPPSSSRASFDAAKRPGENPSATGSVQSLPRLPLRLGPGYRLRKLVEAIVNFGERLFQRNEGRPRRLLILACVVLAPLLLVTFVRLRNAAPTRTVHTEVRLWVRGLPTDATLAWSGKVLANNPTSVPRSNDPAQLTIVCPGYEPLKIELTPSSDLEFSVELVPLRTH